MSRNAAGTLPAGAQILGEKSEHAYYVVYARRDKARSAANLVRVAGRRWEIEVGFEATKGECGLDHQRCAAGRAGTGTSRCRCWHTRCWWHCGHKPKKSVPRADTSERARTQAPAVEAAVGVSHGADHILRWSAWRRRHQRRRSCSTTGVGDAFLLKRIYGCSTRQPAHFSRQAIRPPRPLQNQAAQCRLSAGVRSA